MAGKFTMIAVAGSDGRILGLAHVEEAGGGEFATGLKPLTGQTLHEVEVPEEVFASTSARAVHRWAVHHYVVADSAQVRPIAELMEAETRSRISRQPE